MALLSIILPVYNVEAYLRQSLDSIFCQKEADDCEIILVNDGSTDSSLMIARDYEQAHSNVKVIDKPNEGVSSTRNRGIEEASGEYIFFMDADDLISPESIGVILHNLKTVKPDILSWQYQAFYSQPKYAVPINALPCKKIELSPQETFNYLMNYGIAVSVSTKAIKRSVIGYNIRFNTKMTYGEDMFFSWKCILKSKTVAILDYPLYHYRQTGNSAVSRFHGNLYENYAKAFNEIHSFAASVGISSDSIAKDIDYHFACRLTSLTNMETRAPYSKSQQEEHLLKIVDDCRISNALQTDNRLTGMIYSLARSRNVRKMLSNARKEQLKSKLLFPLKKLLK